MATGQQTTYVGTLAQKSVVSDRIFMLDPMEIALVAALGLDGDSKFKFVDSPGVTYKWLEDAYSGLSSAANAANLTNDSTTTTIVVGDGSLFQAGDIVYIDLEAMYVASVSTNTLTVVRNHGGTQATHVTTSTVYIRSSARLEGADAGDSHYTQPTTGYNYSFILQKTIEISRSDARIKRYGIPNLVEYEKTKKMQELSIRLTKKPYYGIRAAGSATAARDAGGFDTFLSTNVTSLSSAALTLKAIEDNVQSIWDYGGRPSLLICGGWAKRKIVSFFSGAVQTLRSDTLGGVTIDRIQTAMGPQLDVLVDRYCPAASLYILTPDEVSFVTIDEFFHEDLGKVADTEAYGQIVGEYGFALANEKHHGKLHTFSTTA